MSRAIYVRTSPGDNDGSAQLHALRTWCEREGWRDVREYIDRDVSGTKDSRPSWDRLREDVRRGRVRELVATEMSRLGRSVLPVVLALDELHRAGCRVVLLREALDYGTPMGRAVATILAAIAQLERDRIVERVRSGVAAARAADAAGIVRYKKNGEAKKRVGRPRALVAPGLIEKARALRYQGLMPWSQIADALQVPETTLRRTVGAHQKPAKNQQ